jgi:hypothetical protein
MRENRGRFKIAVLNDKVYAIGGSNGTTELDSVEMLDLTKQEKWVKMPNLPLARSNMGVCTLDGLIYCIGGWNGQVGIKQCEVFDPVPSQWSPIASLNTGEWGKNLLLDLSVSKMLSKEGRLIEIMFGLKVDIKLAWQLSTSWCTRSAGATLGIA